MLISFCLVGHPPNIFIITASFIFFFIFLDISMSCNDFYASHFEIAKMTTTPQPSRDTNIADFRAPPPSPVASGRRSTVANDEVLTEFLETSLKVPSLTLPDRAFPRQTSIQNPPTLDFLEFASFSHIEKVAESILQLLRSNKWANHYETSSSREFDGTHYTGAVCYLQKHCSQKVIIGEQRENSLRHDVIRTLIRGSEFPHALSLHICNGCEEFHVYSKKGWSSFQPHKDAIVITLGDKLQVWSSGQYKHVIGRAVFKGISSEDNISLAFLYSPPYNNNMDFNNTEKSFSIRQQIICFLLFSFVYRLWTWISQMF